MIDVINQAINQKLSNMSFTNIIEGKVESLTPIKIRINDRIVIGQSFIEPMSLGITDNSPNSALPLVVGEKVQMIRYNNGQRFYILGKNGLTSEHLQMLQEEMDSRITNIYSYIDERLAGM